MKHYLLDELDKAVALLGLIFALALIVWLTLAIGRLLYVTVGALVLLACIVYLIIRKFASSSILSSLNLAECSSRFYLALNVLFFLLFAYSILSFHLRPDPYMRPLGYFASAALMASIAAVEILFLPSRKWYSYLTLSKIVSMGLSLQFSQLLIFPSIVGVDPWWHQMFTVNMLDTGHIPEGYDYSKLPFMHLMIGSTSLLTGLDYKMATMLSISLSQVLCDVLFTFLLGNFLFNKKIGLLGGLLLELANYHVNTGYWTIPNTMAAVFTPVIVYFLLKVRKEKPYVSVSLAVLIMGALILTHTITSAHVAILLFTFWAGFEVCNRIYGKSKTPVTLGLSILFTVGMLSWWTYASGHITTLGKLIEWGFSIHYFLRPMPEEVIQYYYRLPFSEQLFNNLGAFLFFAMSIIGCLYMISKRLRDSYSFVMAMGGGVTLAISFLTVITGRSVITERWWYFSQVLLALPLALAFFLLCWTPTKSKWGRSLLLAALTFSISFLMILSPTANLDNPMFSPNTQVRYAFTQSELQAIETLSNTGNKTMGVDRHYSDLRWAGYPVKEIDEQFFIKNYSDSRDLFILIREEIVNHPFKIFQATYKLDYDPRETLTSEGFSKVYDCGPVSGFIYPND